MKSQTPPALSLPLPLLETELLLASQMRTSGLVLRAYAHDARTPLNAMQLSLELLAGVLGEADGPWQRHIAVLREEGGKLNRILQALVDQQEPLRASTQCFDLRNIAQEVIGVLRGQAARQRVQLSCDSAPSALTVEGSRDRLRQALLNVAVHALDRQQPSGDSPGRLRFLLESDGRSHAVAVEHRGSPTPQGALESFDGRHPGLWASRLAARSHGGELVIETRDGAERIRIALPAA